MSKEYKVFITHAWEHHDTYDKVVDLLNQDPNFKWFNCSNPDSQPSHAFTDKEYEFELYYQIKPADIVIVIVSLITTYRKWIKKEVDIALEKFEVPKPIIIVESWGAERTPQELQKVSKEMVGWTSLSIIKAVREHALK